MAHGLWSRLISAAVVLAWAGLTLPLALSHAAWRDEADAWLVARDASLMEIVKLGHYIGSPVLWYALLAPFAKAGLPFLTLHLVNWTLAAAAVALLVLRSPLPLALRALLPFTFLFSYEYPVVARSYALTVLLAFAVAALDRERRSSPLAYGSLLALLCQPNAHGSLIALPFIALFVIESVRTRPRERRLLAGSAVAVGGFLLAVAQMLPASDGQATLLEHMWTVRPAIVPLSLARGLFQQWGAAWVILAAAVVASVGLFLRRDRRALLVFLVGVIGLESLFVLVYAGNIRHWGFLLVCAIVALWISPGTGRPGAVRTWDWHVGMGSIVLTALIATAAAVEQWHAERTVPLSGSRAMAEFIVANGLTDVPIAAHPWNGAAVLAYLPAEQFYYPGIDAWGSHMRWDITMVEGKQIGWDEALRRITARFGDREVLLLATQPVERAAEHGFTMLHASTESRRRDETFFLYRRTAPSVGRDGNHQGGGTTAR